MRPWVTFVLAFAAFAVAQSGNNVIDNGASGIQATAGQPLTLTWTNPSSGPVTIKIQTSGNVQPGDGIVLAQGIANTGSATVQIPADVPAGQIFIQIVDDANPDNSNFSSGFQAQGATNTATAVASTGSAASASASASASSASESSASESASSASESSASASASSASESSVSASRASTSRTAASATASQTTAPTGAAAMPVVQGGLMAAMMGAAVLL